MRFVHTILMGILLVGVTCMPNKESFAQTTVTRTSYHDSIEAGQDTVLPYEFNYIAEEPIASGNTQIKNPLRSGFRKNFAGALGITYDPGRIDFAINAAHGQRAYDGRQETLSAIAAFDNVKQNYADVELKAAYDLTGNIKPYVAVQVGTHDYDQYDLSNRGFSDKKGDSRNAGIMTGLQFVYKGFIEGFLGVGYEKRSYRNDKVEDIANLKMSSELGLNLSQKAKLKLGFERFSTEDRQTLQGKVVNRSRIQIDYNFLHNLFFNAFINYSYDNYRNFSRDRDYLSAGTGLRYEMDSGMTLSGDYNFEGKDSRAFSRDEDSHEFLLKLNTRF